MARPLTSTFRFSRNGPSAGVFAPVLTEDSDATLLAALLEDRARLGQALFDAYGLYVRKILWRILGPNPEIGDLTQDVFVVALESLRSLREPRALRSWLFKITLFRAHRYIRYRKQWRILSFFAPDECPVSNAAPHDFEASESLRAVYRVLAKMSADEQIVFALRVLEEMDLSEVADACGVSLATTKRRLARAEVRFTELARLEPSLAEWLEAHDEP
jgi:RNA polymerase sigma-70 factor (ECF subfamily)